MDATLVSSLALSGVIGFTLGTFGGGGSILAVPVLVFVTHLTPAAAVGTSLAMVAATSFVASYAHHCRTRVRLKVGLLFSVSGMFSAFFGAKLSQLVSGAVLMRCFAALLLLVGIGMLVNARRARSRAAQEPRGPTRVLASLLAGAGVGLLTGFLGVGGGFLVVPALMTFAGLDMRAAVGTSLLVIGINSVAGFLGHLQGGQLDLGLIAVLTAVAVAGALLGERFARHVSTEKLRRGFALLVIAVGVVVALADGLGGHLA